MTEHANDGHAEAYLYRAADDATVCVSCRRDGRPSIDPIEGDSETVVLAANGFGGELSPPRSLSIDGSRVFFTTRNRLAVGATEGQRNLYQWEDGQVSFLATSELGRAGKGLSFAGASTSGDDVYFTTTNQLTGHDRDALLDVYDARVGGGFPDPPTPPTACDPLASGGCGDGGGAGSAESLVETGRGGSGDVALPPRATFRVAGLSRVQRTRLIAGRRVAVRVRVNGPGRVSVVGRARIGGFAVRVLSASRTATSAGMLRVPVVLSRAARNRARATGSLKVSLVTRFAGARKDSVRRLTFASPPAKRGKQRRTATTDRRAAK